MATNKASPSTKAPSADFFYKLASAVPGILFSYWLSADKSAHCYPYVSEQIRERFGLDPEALKQNADAVLAIVHPDDAGGLQDSIFESARTLEPWQYRARLRLQDGSYQWYEAHSRPERQADGSTLWYGQFHNIQHYKELEQELRDSEAEYSFQAGFQKLVARLSAQFINVGFGTIDDCISELLESVGVFFTADRTYLYAFNDDHTSATKTHQWCRDGVRSVIDEDQSVPLDDQDEWGQKLLEMVDENEVVFIEATSEAASVFCVPVRVQGQVVGFMGLDSLAPRKWREDQSDLLIIVSGLLSGALERHILEEKLLSQSIRDPMTGLHNRRYLMPRLNELVERAERYDENFTVAMLDIDHFKQINDSIGHLGGDYTLRRFADILIDLVRSTDVVARFGGEEFMVVFPDTEQATVHQTISRILDAVRHGRFVFEGREIPLTVSAGLASVRERDDSMISVDTVIGRADHRLYLAKQAGRDCAVDISGVLRI
ncbi:diguanylate cyclase [Marinobacter sp. M216]|uniref:diguanylate cyclase n=1 Tax=Marinobacter albus TaxID=3030833 RepID=A0ABT7HE22_9GAMM|nr:MULTISPECIES: diguanylate cyclase [unclassified Marinobacter]MBW7472045.1 diguanylate cyclase [Marinobacter sp. F4218]MDK9558615.1 diguanylate cyclase [Marinobacter sp. M216]